MDEKKMFTRHMADKLIAHIERMLSLMNRNENKLNSENGANYIHEVSGRVQSETILDISSVGNVRWLQRLEGLGEQRRRGKEMMRKGRRGEDQRSEAEACLLLLLQGCLKL